MHSSGHICPDTHSIMRPVPILPPQLTQLGQQTTFYNSPNYPAGPCLVQLPQRDMLIYNVTGSGISTLHCPYTHIEIPLHRTARIPPYVCLSCWWLRLWLSWAGSPLKPVACCTYPSWLVTVHRKKNNHQLITSVRQVTSKMQYIRYYKLLSFESDKLPQNITFWLE